MLAAGQSGIHVGSWRIRDTCWQMEDQGHIIVLAAGGSGTHARGYITRTKGTTL